MLAVDSTPPVAGLKAPARRARNPDGSRKRTKPRRLASDADISSLTAADTGHTSISDVDWKNLGLFALDSVNGNSWEAASAQVLPRSTADVVFLQETKVFSESGLDAIKASGRKLG